MLLENMKQPKYIKRILLTLLLPVFAFTSTLVHAQNTEEYLLTADSTKEERYFAPLIIPLDGDTNIFIDTLEDMPVRTQPPLVQALTQAPASVDSLYQETDYDIFFEHSVFVGDSLTVGFQGFCSHSASSIASESTYFLAKESGSAQAAISANALTTFANIMPKYQGEVQLIEDSIAQMTDVEKAFICFGMNDLVSATPDKFVQNLETLIQRILEKRPDISIYVLSIPCVVEDVQTGSLSNATIRNANALLAAICIEKQWGFINTTEYLMSDTLAIRNEYSSDGYVHENAAAYRVWTSVLRNYAYKSMQ